MKFMVMHYSSEENEAGNAHPTPELMEAMGKLLEKSAAEGILLAGEGVHPMTKGARVTYSGGKKIVKDGPFAEAKEVIAGFAIINVESKQAAIDFCDEFAAIVGDVQIDVRQVVEFDDMGPDFTPEMREREEKALDQAAKNASN